MLRKIIYVLFSAVFLLTTVTVYGHATSSAEKMLDKKAAAQDRRDAFKEKLQTIQDERKKALVEKIDAKFTSINTKRTDRWVEVLNKLSSITARLDGKIASAEADGKDVNAAKDAIEDANDAIATAQSAVSSQAGKEYTIEITSETGLRLAVGKVMSQLQADLRATHKTVVNAKQAVMNAAKEVKKLQNSAPAE